MPLGEAPITSYFPRRAQGKGKQQNRSNANRKSQKLNVPAEITVNSQPAKPREIEDSEPSNKRSRATTSGSLSSLSSLTSLSSGSPPPVWALFSSRTRKSKKRRNVSVKKTCSIISLEDSDDDDCPTKNRAGPLLVKATQPPRPVAKAAETIDRVAALYSNDLPGPTSSSKNSQLYRLPPSDESEIEIQSSQAFERQGESLHVSCTPQLVQNGAAPSTFAIDFHHNRGTDPTTNNSWLGLAPNDLSEDVKDPPIDSSQTQNVLLNYVSPQRSRIRKCLFDTPLPPRTEDIEDVVRSSQSQYEVAISQLDNHRLQRLLSPQGRSKTSSYRNRVDVNSQPPVRTYSDELFSVPRRDAVPTENCAQGFHQPTNYVDPLGDVDRATDQRPVQEDSETEPDTDNETFNSRDTKHLRRRSQPSLCSSSRTQSGRFVSPDDEFTQLPDAVEEFQAMFGSDESYPTDFPSSLRP